MLLGHLQESLLVLLSYDDKNALLIRNTIEPQHWGGHYRLFASRIYDYIDRFKKAPKDHLPDIMMDKLEGENKREAELYIETIESIIATRVGINEGYIMSSLDLYVKRQSLRAIAVDFNKALIRDTDESLEEAAELMAKANVQTLKVFDPGIRLSNKEALSFLDIQEHSFPTGIPELDRRGFGPTRKELWQFIANTKSGKCLAEGEPILLSDGGYVPIESFGLLNGSVPTLIESHKKFTHRQAVLVPNGLKDTIKLTTRTGRSIIVTPNHRLLTKRGWVEAQSIALGEGIAAPFELPIFGINQSDLSTMRLLGYLIADGGMSKPSTPTFTKKDPAVVKDFSNHAKMYDCYLKPALNVPDNYYVVSRRKNNAIVNLLKCNGLQGKKSNAKVVPPFIFRLRKEYIVNFLQALFTCDGSIYDGQTGATFEYSTTSPVLARQIDHLLTRFGLVAKIRERWQTVAGKPYVSWSLLLSSRGQVIKFRDEIGLLFGKGKKLDALIKKHGKSNRESYLSNDRAGKIFFDKLTKVEEAGYRQTYDLSVDKHHNFIAGNLIVHNSWMLIQLAKMAALHKFKVCHISLEMSRERCAQRYYQSLFGISKRKETFNTTRFKRDSLNRITGYEDTRVTPRLSLDDPKIHERLGAKIDQWADRLLDNIIIRDFPTGQLTVRQLEAYLDNLEQVERFIPDLLVIDYPALMKLDKDNYRLALDEVYKDIRGICVRRNLAGAIVSQSHRSAAKAKTVGIENIAENYAANFHCDTNITYSQTAQERKLNLARLFVGGGRNDVDKITVVISQQYGFGAFVIDSSPLIGQYWEHLPRNGFDDEDE